MATTFTLLRHAEHDGDPGVLMGRTPGVCLSPTGRAQAARLAERLGDAAFDLVHTSPMQRCQQTASALAGPAVVSEELNEIDFGAWTGRSFAALDSDPAWQRWNDARDRAAPPGGETMAAVQDRAAAVLARLQRRHPDGRVALVSHADVIKALVLHTLGLSLRAHARLAVDLASATTIVAWPGGSKLLGLNDTGRHA